MSGETVLFIVVIALLGGLFLLRLIARRVPPPSEEPPGPKQIQLRNDEGPDVRFMGFKLAQAIDAAHGFIYELYRAVGGQYVLQLQGWSTPSTEGKRCCAETFPNASELVKWLFSQQDSWKRRLAKDLITKAAEEDPDLARASVTEL